MYPSLVYQLWLHLNDRLRVMTNKGQYQRETEVVVAYSSGSLDSFAGSALDKQMSTFID